MRDIVSGFRLQLILYRRHPDVLVPLLTSPLYMIVFRMVLHGSDLAGYGVLAPFYMSLWWFALFCGGWVIQTDRWHGTVEYLVGTPASFTGIVLGRVAATTVPALGAAVELWLFGRYVVGADVTIRHWPVFVASFLLTLFAMVATALLMASAFVLARSAVTFSNSLSFPFYLLGGILIPVSLLPGWMQPLSKGVFLSWSSQLLRASLDPRPVPPPYGDLGMIFLLGCAALGAGYGVLRVILRRMRHTGELGAM
jgi:ABC-2 type transport system permease protein